MPDETAVETATEFDVNASAEPAAEKPADAAKAEAKAARKVAEIFAEEPEEAPAEAPKEKAAGDAEKPLADDKSADGEAPAEKKDGEKDSEPEGAVAPEFDDEILARAESLGLSRKEAEDFGTQEALDRGLLVLDRRLADLGRQATQAEKPQAPAAKKKGEAQPEAAPEGELDLAELKLDEELDPSVKGPLQAIQKELLKTREMLSASEAARSAVNEERRNRFLDEQFAALGDEWSEVVGKGSLQELAEANPKKYPDDPVVKNRMAVVREMNALDAGYRASNQVPLPEAELFKRALRLAHGERFDTLARKKLASKLSRRAGQAVGRPTHRAAAPLSGPEKAVKSAREILQKAGASAESDGV